MPKRRGHGEGSIYQRKDGRWEARISLPSGASGKRKRRAVYGKTRADVAAKLHDLQHAKRSGWSIEPSKLTVGQYLEGWIREIAAPRVRASTLAEYQRHVDRVTKSVGEVPLKTWKAPDIRALWAEFERRKIGSRTRHAIHATIRQAMGDAVRDGLIIANPTDAVVAPRQATPNRRFLTPDQVRILLETADKTETPQTIALVTLLAGTGMRIGELLALRWEDIDLARATVQIRRTLVEVKGKFVEHEPKTRAGIRTISLPNRAVDRVRRHRKARAKLSHGSGLIFQDRNGRWLRKTNLYQRVLGSLLIKAELPTVGWHALRHAHATALLVSGEPIADVAARLGHHDSSLTMRIYAHALPDRGAEIAAKVEKLLSRSESRQ